MSNFVTSRIRRLLQVLQHRIPSLDEWVKLWNKKEKVSTVEGRFGGGSKFGSACDKTKIRRGKECGKNAIKRGKTGEKYSNTSPEWTIWTIWTRNLWNVEKIFFSFCVVYEEQIYVSTFSFYSHCSALTLNFEWFSRWFAFCLLHTFELNTAKVETCNASNICGLGVIGIFIFNHVGEWCGKDEG